MAAKRKTKRKRQEQRKAKKAEVLHAEDIKARQERQLRTILFWMILLTVFVVFFIIFYRNASTFYYKGIKFQKLNMNGLTLYKTVLQFTRIEGVFKFDLYLRNNPKDLDKIPSNGTIVLKKGGFVSFEPSISRCYGSNIAAHELGTFLSALGMVVKGATTDKNLSEQQSLILKTCQDAVNSTVIVLRTSNESSVEQEGNCYILNTANCNSITVAEKFILETTSQMFQRNKEKAGYNNSK